MCECKPFNIRNRGGRENKLAGDHSGALEGDCRPGIVVQIVQCDNGRVHDVGKEGQKSLKVSKERRVVQRPFGCCLKQRQRVSDLTSVTQAALC